MTDEFLTDCLQRRAIHDQDNPKEKHLWNQTTTNATSSGYLGGFLPISQGYGC